MQAVAHRTKVDFAPLAEARHQAAEWFTPSRFGAMLAIFLLAVFPRVVLGLDSFVYRDYGVLAYPVIHYARESFWRGELPLWNPLSNCGAPFLAQWGTMTLYPLSILYLLFPLPWSLGFFCLGHLWLGGLGMYFLARRWVGDQFGASVAGTAFVFNGITLSCLMWPNYTVALGWMPWVMLAVERAWREGGRSIVLAALAGTLQMLAGVQEIASFTWLLAVAFWIGSWIAEKPQWKLMTLRFLAIVLLVAGLTAIQLLPFFDLLAHSQRDRAFASTKWALPGWGWANLLVPLFHCFESYQGPFIQEGQAFFSSCYLGAGVLALALIGVWRAGNWRAKLLGAFTLFALIAALAENGHLYSWMKSLIPLLGVARYPVKFMVLSAFAVPLLAGFAIGWWRQRPATESRRAARDAVREAMHEDGEQASLRDAEFAPVPDRGLKPTATGTASLRDAAWFVGVGGVLLGTMGAILWFAYQYPFPLDQWPVTWHNTAWRAVFLLGVLGAVVLLPRLRASGEIENEGKARAIYSALPAAILILLALDVSTHTPHFNPTVAASEFEPGLWQRARQTPPPKLAESRAMIFYNRQTNPRQGDKAIISENGQANCHARVHASHDVSHRMRLVSRRTRARPRTAC